jgi:Ras family
MTNIKSRKIAVMGSRSVGTVPLPLSGFQIRRPFRGKTNRSCSGVGKSSLTVQYVESHFVESYYPTIENTFSKHVKIKNQEYSVEIIDTAGQVAMTPPPRICDGWLMSG